MKFARLICMPLLLVACGAPEASAGPTANPGKAPDSPAPAGKPEDQAVQGTWSGPAVRAWWVAPGGALAIRLTAPTLGYELALDEVVLVGTNAEVRCKMTRPHDEVVGQVVTDVDLEVPAAKIPAAATTAIVLIATWDRGVQYFRAPDHEKVLSLPIAR